MAYIYHYPGSSTSGSSPSTTTRSGTGWNASFVSGRTYESIPIALGNTISRTATNIPMDSSNTTNKFQCMLEVTPTAISGTTLTYTLKVTLRPQGQTTLSTTGYDNSLWAVYNSSGTAIVASFRKAIPKNWSSHPTQTWAGKTATLSNGKYGIQFRFGGYDDGKTGGAPKSFTMNIELDGNSLLSNDVVYNANGGTFTSAYGGGSTYTQSVEYNGSDTVIPTSALKPRSGYVLDSGVTWNTASDGSGTRFEPDSSYYTTTGVPASGDFTTVSSNFNGTNSSNFHHPYKLNVYGKISGTTLSYAVTLSCAKDSGDCRWNNRSIAAGYIKIGTTPGGSD